MKTIIEKKKSRLLKWLLAIVIIISVLASWTYWQTRNLPDEAAIRSYQPKSTVKSMNKWQFPAFPNRPARIWIPLKSISPNLQQAVLVSEDDTFYEHDGLNLSQMKKAFQDNLKKHRYARGASTITMQLARNAFLDNRKNLLRKFREIIIARRMEKSLSKKRIFELYLNVIEWGNNIYGAEAAAQYYFNKPAADLNLAEASLLAAMLPGPKRFNPYTRLKKVQHLQHRVLNLLQLNRIITKEESLALQKQPIYLRGIELPKIAPAKPDSNFTQILQDTCIIIKDSSLIK